jgi:hypothetical protein
MLDDFRHRLLLVDARLPAAIEQRQARLQGDFVTRFVHRRRQTLEGADHTEQGAQRLDLGQFQPRQGLDGRRVQAETRVLAEQLLRAEVELAAGEFDGVEEGLLRRSWPSKASTSRVASRLRTWSLWRLWSKKVRTIEHVQTSLAAGGVRPEHRELQGDPSSSLSPR